MCFVKTEDNKGFYFDSYGYPPYNLPEVAEVLEHCDSWTFNDIQLQTTYSTVCGQYTIFVLTHLARGFTIDHIIELINENNGDTFSNDAIMFNYINNMYGKDISTEKLSIVDFPFIFNQSVYPNE